MGWFFGFKLRLAVNDRGELRACCLTPGNVDDRTPVPELIKRLRGKLFGDCGSISAPLSKLLFEQGLQLMQKSCAPAKLRKPPEIFCCTLTIRLSRSP